ncbi:MAG TPA: YhjD/YihY/BrkB family envelope integrity protein, partial [Gemmatimonadaceae bacterium]
MADRRWVDAAWAARDYLWRVWDNSAEDNILFLAGGIAFNILLAAIPFILLVITGFTYLLPKLIAVSPATAVHQFIGGFLPTQNGAGATLVHGIVDDVLRTRGKVTIYSAVIFFWLSTRLFASLRAALASVFDIEKERAFLHGVAFDLLITVVFTLLFAASQVISGYLLLGT